MTHFYSRKSKAKPEPEEHHEEGEEEELKEDDAEVIPEEPRKRRAPPAVVEQEHAEPPPKQPRAEEAADESFMKEMEDAMDAAVAEPSGPPSSSGDKADSTAEVSAAVAVPEPAAASQPAVPGPAAVAESVDLTPQMAPEVPGNTQQYREPLNHLGSQDTMMHLGLFVIWEEKEKFNNPNGG